MGMRIRHVALVSGVLAAGAFVYVVGFWELDESGYGVGGRSSGGSARAGERGELLSYGGMVSRIRRALMRRQMSRADHLAEMLVEQYPQDLGAYYYRAMVDMELGRNESQVGSWAKLGALLDLSAGGKGRAGDGGGGEGGEVLGGQYSQSQLDYLRGWAQHGTGEYVDARVIFNRLADEMEQGRRGEYGEIGNPNVLYALACYRAMGGQVEAAMVYWERAIESGFVDDGWWAFDPDLEPLHDDARFWVVGGGVPDGSAASEESEEPGESEESEESGGAAD